jgi:hypothetical protein
MSQDRVTELECRVKELEAEVAYWRSIAQSAPRKTCNTGVEFPGAGKQEPDTRDKGFGFPGTYSKEFGDLDTTNRGFGSDGVPKPAVPWDPYHYGC